MKPKFKKIAQLFPILFLSSVLASACTDESVTPSNNATSSNKKVGDNNNQSSEVKNEDASKMNENHSKDVQSETDRKTTKSENMPSKSQEGERVSKSEGAANKGKGGDKKVDQVSNSQQGDPNPQNQTHGPNGMVVPTVPPKKPNAESQSNPQVPQKAKSQEGTPGQQVTPPPAAIALTPQEHYQQSHQG